MSLDLDDRQRALLQEMGVHVWWPAQAAEVAKSAIEKIATEARSISAKAQKSSELPAPAPSLAPPQAPVPPPAAPRPASPARKSEPVLAAALTGSKDLPDGIASMDWSDLAQAVSQCQACAMCLGRLAPVLTPLAPLLACDWLVVGDPPDEVQERAGLPFVDDAGLLLDNMLRAVGVQRVTTEPDATPAQPAKRAYLTHVLKCRPQHMRAPDAAELAACAHYLRREIALTQPKVILVMGRFAMQTLLSEAPPEIAKMPLGKLRGQVVRFAGVPVVVTYPPAYLLRNPQDKAKAWSDLCLAADVAQAADLS